ncbi:hypothetical protein GCM10022254_32690 [Actinomadura meridiana]|uniref:Uncharacterized protein n=1 Tax=Actinomadura meridiana TaxID=559626 RepID=A0ABP8C2V8_9ACTN
MSDPTPRSEPAANELDLTGDVDTVKARLREAFPRWSIIQSDQGRWWATRGPLTREDINRQASVDAASPQDLAEEIRKVSRGG